MIKKDYKDMKYGKLTAKSFAFVKNNKTYWNFLCECGKEITCRVDEVFSGKRRRESCGCTHKFNIKHGMSKHKLMRTLADIKQRCLNPNCKAYSRYGAKNINICDEWKNNSNSFFEWSINNGYQENLTIDRINNNLGYTPENCRWVDKSTQSANRKNKGNIDFCKNKNLWRLRIVFRGKVLLSRYSHKKEELVAIRNSFISNNMLPHNLI